MTKAERKQSQFYIEGVPLLRQEYGNWCGYTALSAILQYWGYSDLTPEKIFGHIQGDIAETNMLNIPAPSIDTLALTAQELTSLKVDLLTERQYEVLRDKGITPQDVLQAYIVKRQTPCIIRIPGHFIVVNGVDLENNSYVLNSIRWGEKSLTADDFEMYWASPEPDYPRDTRHLMLAIYPANPVKT